MTWIQAKPRLSVRAQALATLSALAAALVLPQIAHAVAGSEIGTMLLPMYFPILLVGMLAGPFAGAIAGLLAPLCSFVLSGMPAAAVLPVITVELIASGLFSGLLRSVKLPVFCKVLAVQVGAKLVRLLAVLLLGTLPAASVWGSVTDALPGLALQWLLLPLIVYAVERQRRKE